MTTHYHHHHHHHQHNDVSFTPMRLHSPYHLIHYVFLAYFFFKLYPESIRASTPNGFLTNCLHEELVIMMFVVFLFKVKHVRNTDEAMHRFLVHAKTLSLALVILSGDSTAILGMLALYGSWLVWLVPPRYQGPTNAIIMDKEEDFRNKIWDNNHDDRVYLVNFQNIWVPDCYYFEPIFAQMSLRYHPSLQFVSVNIDKFPNLAKDLELDVVSNAGKLPSLILFHCGREIRRLSTTEASTLEPENVAEYFELHTPHQTISDTRRRPVVKQPE